MFDLAESWNVPFTLATDTVFNRIVASTSVKPTLKRRSVWIGAHAYLVQGPNDFWAVLGELRFLSGTRLIASFPFAHGNSPTLNTLVLLTPSTPAGVPWLELKTDLSSVASYGTKSASVPAHVFQEVECDQVALFIQRIYVGLTTGANIGFLTGLRILSE